MKRSRSIVLLSGGLDSTVAFYQALDEVKVAMAISFDYGQRHKGELKYAQATAHRENIPYEIIDITSIGRLLQGSALSDRHVEVPDGHYAEKTMKATIVPNRNTIMLSMAVGAAIGIGASQVWAAMHAGDHPIYPDCRPEFIDKLNELVPIATESAVVVVAPFIDITKDMIIRRGHRLGVDFGATWSCYKGGKIHCGRCGTCVERAEAFFLAGVRDPTQYEDKEYWKRVTSSLAERERMKEREE